MWRSVLKQTQGVAMGVSPVSPTHSSHYRFVWWYLWRKNMVGKYEECINVLDWIIDDSICLWDHDSNPVSNEAKWICSKTTINSCGLKRTCLPRSQSTVFVDITLSIDNEKLATSLYEKSLALYLYIPPHCCQALGTMSRSPHWSNFWNDPENLPTVFQRRGYSQWAVPVHEDNLRQRT
jgi:hypothetical protein